MTARAFRFLPRCVAGLVGAWVAVAAAQDLPRSAACRTALDALDRAEEAVAASAAASASLTDAEHRRAVAARLQPMRVRVANACLGGMTTSPPPSQHDWVVPAPARPLAAMPRAQPPATPAAAVPPPRFEPPVTVSNCNAATCLGSDGSTLTRVGPNLVGPRGLCTVQGAFLHCP